MNLVVSGLTAAGKTTACGVIGHLLSADYFSASRDMLAMLGVNDDGQNSVWTTGLREIDEARDQGDIDSRLNDLLVRESQERSNTVFDSWSLPWLAEDDDCYKIWIDSTLESRALKVRVSQEPSGPFLSLDECGALATEKDEATIARFQTLLGVDISTDRSPFDLVLDFSAYISEPTLDAAYRGIRAGAVALAGGMLADEKFASLSTPGRVVALRSWLASQTDGGS